MSKPRFGWWGYVKWMIRGYKNGALLTKAEIEAVRAAVAETEQLADGAERMKLVDMVLWRRTHTIQGAAMAIFVSDRTAREWHRQFVQLVARKRGLF